MTWAGQTAPVCELSHLPGFFRVIGGAEGWSLPAPGPGAAAYDPATNTWTVLPPALS